MYPQIECAKAKAERPSITTFLKPRVASSEGVKNDVGEPREALIKTRWPKCGGGGVKMTGDM